MRGDLREVCGALLAAGGGGGVWELGLCVENLFKRGEKAKVSFEQLQGEESGWMVAYRAAV